MTTYPYPNVFESYEAKRDTLRVWAHRRYVEAFGLEPGTLLDVGCGEGFWGDLFREWGFTVTGFDKEAEFIAVGKDKYPELELHTGNVDNLPLAFLKGRTFETVFVKQLPHFYKEDLVSAQAVLENLRPYMGQRILLSFYTDGTGKFRDGLFGGYQHFHHRYGDLLGVCKRAGYTLHRQERHGRYLQAEVS